MIKKLTSTLWGVITLILIYLCSISLFAEYVISRESVHPLIIMVTTLGAMGCTYYLASLIFNFTYNHLKEKKND
jgi:hypothetical protein